MAKPKHRDIKIQLNGKFNTNGTIHETIEEAFAYWDRKLPNDNKTNLIYPSDADPRIGMTLNATITCFSLDYAKQWLGE